MSLSQNKYQLIVA